MANRYEKLDQFLNDAFRDSPNTLEANEVKIEIITNLRQMYDDLMESGMSEAEALAKTCDSLGNPAEIFGSMGDSGYFDNARHMGTEANPQAEPNTAPKTETARHPKPPASPFRSLVITLGILLCALCWLPTVLFAVNDTTEGWIAAPVLISVALGVLCFIYAGCMRVGVSLKTRLHYLFIGLGVACEIACASPIIMVTESQNWGLGLSMLFALVAAGIILIVVGAVIPTDKWDSTEEEKKAKSPLDRAMGLMVLAVYLLLSFITGAWAVTWIVFLIGSAVRTLISAISDLKSQEGGNDL